MAAITASMVAELRAKTDAPMMECKKALTEADGDMAKAEELLRVKLGTKAGKAASRVTAEGVIAAHVAGDKGAMVEVNCETDFVAKTDDFKAFARNIAMHVAAVNPLALSRDEVSAEVLQREKDIYINQALESGKPQQIAEKMVAGKMEKFLAEVCLLEQKYVKNPDLSVQDLLNELVAKMGENISIKKFARFQIG